VFAPGVIPLANPLSYWEVDGDGFEASEFITSIDALRSAHVVSLRRHQSPKSGKINDCRIAHQNNLLTFDVLVGMITINANKDAGEPK
jgi:hypothetical protein